MKFSLLGVNKLRSPVVVSGRTYIIKAELFLTPHFLVSFISPSGVKIDLEMYADPYGSSWVWPTVDGARIRHPADNAFEDTTDLPKPLRPLVEQAVADLISEERAQDPTGRHAELAARVNAAKVEAIKAAEALKRL